MSDVKSLGKVFESDILIVGGGFAGLVTAIRAKQEAPEADVLIVERCFAGYSGQSSKAGNGIVGHADFQNVMESTEWMVKNQTPYLNDQELLYDYLSTNTDSVKWLHDFCGVLISENEDGSLKYWVHPESKLVGFGIELRAIERLRRKALEMGVRILNETNIFEVLTNNGVVCGAIGIGTKKGDLRIFHAKAVAIATHGCQFKKLGREFLGYGTGVGAIYRAGGLIRNIEFSTQIEIVFKGTNVPVYGGYNLIFNQNGENISKKYAPNAPEISIPLLRGMVKEVEEGRGPLYVDLRVPDETLISIGWEGMQIGDGRLMPDKMEWENYVESKSSKYTMEHSETPEITIDQRLQAEPVKVNHNFKTDVEALWAPGKISYQGSAYFGWHRGDGVGNAAQTGLRAGKDIGEFVKSHDKLDLDYDQVAAYKEKIYAPMNRKEGYSPYEIFDRIEKYGFGTKMLSIKSAESLKQGLKDVEDMKKIAKELKADDPHMLAKCHEASDTLLNLEMIFRASMMRTESRGVFYPHYRLDHPESDNKNWLKWINVKQGENGEMELFTEDIPMWKYPFRPEGYEIPEGHKEEYFVNGKTSVGKEW